MNIEKDSRPIVYSLIWSWVLGFVPTFLRWRKWSKYETTVSDGSITQRSGGMSKKFVNVELDKIQNITALDSPFKGGTLIVHTPAGAERLMYIANPGEVAQQLRQMVKEARS